MLVEPNEPGNLGAIIRTADAAGADAVVFDGGSSTRTAARPSGPVPAVCSTCPWWRARPRTCWPATDRLGLRTLATTGDGDVDLDRPRSTTDGWPSRQPWLFGNEAHGLPNSVLAAADVTVRIPIYGRAESLNLAAAAAVCLYASARAHRA